MNETNEANEAIEFLHWIVNNSWVLVAYPRYPEHPFSKNGESACYSVEKLYDLFLNEKELLEL